MTGRVTRLVALAAIAWFASASQAHETRPGYLELRESDPTTYALLWKRPTGGEVEIQIAPVGSMETDAPEQVHGRHWGYGTSPEPFGSEGRGRIGRSGNSGSLGHPRLQPVS